MVSVVFGAKNALVEVIGVFESDVTCQRARLIPTYVLWAAARWLFFTQNLWSRFGVTYSFWRKIKKTHRSLVNKNVQVSR